MADNRERAQRRSMMESPTQPFVCACCGYRAVDVDDLINHKPLPDSAVARLIAKREREAARDD